MIREPDEWTLEGFLSHFQSVHSFMPDHPFCWIIGAGASKSSGIPTGAELADWWLRDLHERECSTTEPLEKWATAENLNIREFSYDRVPEFYPQIYQRRFKDFPDEGYAYLEHVMTGKAKQRTAKGLKETSKVIEPGPGYSFLAKILENTSHRAVITTNFDNLVADALQIFTSTYPFVCGHESLTGFVRVAVRRPIVCKIHRDLLLGPFNEPRQLRVLHEAWAAALRALLGSYTPIVIGYGGNDDSLMERLASLDPSEVKGRLIWCYYQGAKRDSRPSQRIRKLVGDLGGVLVPVPDFDRLMVLLGARINIEPLDEDLKTRLTARIERYTEQLVEMPTSDLPQLRTALSKTYARAKLDWWQWQLKIEEYDDLAEKESLYREAIGHCKKSPELTGNFANLMRERGKHDEAERLYRAALELDPAATLNTANFAGFLTDIRKEHDEAESLYRKALELAPGDVRYIRHFAIFLSQVRGEDDEAEQLFRKAIELDPSDYINAQCFASFLAVIKKRYGEAARVVEAALEKAPEKQYWLLTDLAEYRICDGRESDAIALLESAQGLIHPGETQAQCIALLNLAIATSLAGSATKPHFEELDRLLLTKFSRDGYNWELVPEAIGDRLPRHFVDKCRAYGAAIANAEHADSLSETLAVIEKEAASDAKKAGKGTPRHRKASPRGSTSAKQ